MSRELERKTIPSEEIKSENNGNRLRYVGLVTAAISQAGHWVTGVDRDPLKINKLRPKEVRSTKRFGTLTTPPRKNRTKLHHQPGPGVANSQIISSRSEHHP